MKPQDPRDFGAGLLYLVLGLAFALGARQYAQGQAAAPGPGFFPFYLGLGLAAVGALLVLRAFRRDRSARPSDADEALSFPWRSAAWVLGGVMLFGLSLRPLGLFVAVPLLVVCATQAGRRRPSLRFVLLLAAALALLAWGIFVLGLRLQIPVGPTGLGAIA